MSHNPIYFGYQWDNGSADSAMPDDLPGRVIFKKKNENFVAINEDETDEIWLKRLRATSGSSVNNLVMEKLSNCELILFDISQANPNVWIDVGMNLTVKGTRKEHFKIFLLKETSHINFCNGASSDFLGYFLFNFECTKNHDIIFKDRNSFLNSMQSDILNLRKYLKQLDILQEEKTIH